MKRTFNAVLPIPAGVTRLANLLVSCSEVMGRRVGPESGADTYGGHRERQRTAGERDDHP